MAKTSARRTSTKAGLRSVGQKREEARHGFAPQPASRQAEGATGLEGRGAARHGGAATEKAGKRAALKGLKGTKPSR